MKRGGLCVYVNSNVVPGSSAALGVFAEGADLEEYLLRYICWELKEAKQQAQTMQEEHFNNNVWLYSTDRGPSVVVHQ